MDSKDARQVNGFAAIAYRQVAREKQAQGDFVSAESFLKRALHIVENRYGKQHGEAGMVLIELAELYDKWERPLDRRRTEKRIDEIVENYTVSEAS